MAAKEVKKTTTNLTCPICYQLFKNPKYLPCYHSYCEECLEKMVVQSKITCPECRQEAVVPVGGVKELANNFFINRMVDELVLQRKVEGEEEVKCDECDEDEPVVSYCPECNMFLCHVCNDFHKCSKRFCGHGVVLLTELRTNKDVPLQAKTVAAICKEHDIELLFYCETCEQLVCMYCTVKDHNGHNHDTVKKMAGKHRQELKEIIAPVEEMITSLSEAHDNIDKIKVKIRQQGEEVNKKIDQHYGELVQKLMEQKEQLKQQVHDTVSQKEKAVTTQLEEVENVQAEMLSMKELKDAVEKSSDQESLSAKKLVINRMQQLTDKYKKLNTQPVQSAAMEYVSSKDPIPQFGQLLTQFEVINLPNQVTRGQRVKCTIITKYSTGHPCFTEGSQVFVQVQSSTGEVTATHNNDGSYTASFVAQQIGEIKILVSVNGHQVKGSPHSVVVLNNYTALNKPRKIVNNDGQIGYPWGIAFCKNGMWAVADLTNHCIHIFDDQDQLVRTFGSKGSSEGQLYCPRGIKFQNDHLFVADYWNHRIQKFDINGKYLLQFSANKTKYDELEYPTGITTHNDKVYVADTGNNCISVFQSNGHFCHTIGEQHLKYPCDVVVTNNNQLFVVDYDSHCICTFTVEGHFINKFGTKGSDRGQLYYPRCLAVDANGFILVTDFGNCRVSIFDKHGNCVHQFGSCGSDGGQFYLHSGIALSPNGDIYVSDGNNKRVQIFSTL